MSPTSVGYPLFHRKSRSPRSNAGSIDPDSTTTIGEEESAAIERPFHIMKAVDIMKAKFRSCRARERGEEGILVVVVVAEWWWWCLLLLWLLL